MQILEVSYKSLYLELSFDGKVISNATGFIVKSGENHFLITNRHVVTGRNNDNGELLDKMGCIPNEIRISHNLKNSLGRNWFVCTEPLYKNSNDFDGPLWIEHPKWGKSADFVAIKLNPVKEVVFLPYSLEERRHPLILNPTDIVSVVGFPFGLSARGKLAIWATGFIASDLSINYDNLPIFLIDCRTRPGQSGSPVIAHRNIGQPHVTTNGSTYYDEPMTDLIGVYSGRINAESDIGKVWKKSAILELINSFKNT